MSTRLPLLERIIFPSAPSSFICPNCRDKLPLFAWIERTRAQHFRRAHGQRRAASTIPSVTAVNVKREIPATLQALHSSLKILDRDARVYVNTSQLQLALRGIESEDPVTRVAVLGLDDQSGARRLTRALLADPLNKEQSWERNILDSDERDERAILLRYNETFAADERHPLVRTFSIPSPTLRTHRLEILVHAASSITGPANEGAASLLVPSLEIATSGAGGSSMVTYPVHKALLYEEGLKNLATLATIAAPIIKGGRGRMFKGAIDWSWSTAQQRTQGEQPVTPINLALAEAAIDTIRRSLDKSLEYEHLWFDAGMPALSTWLLDGTEVSSGSIKPSVKRLVETLCMTTNQGIRNGAAAKLQQEKGSTVSVTSRNIINQGITIWAENAHAELRDRLNIAFGGKSWRKTKWWKLFWRVDDVGYIASDILHRAWLVEAEKEMIWIIGRIYQSGLLGPPKLRPAPVPDPEGGEQKLGGRPPAPSAADLAPQASNFNEPPPLSQHPWPQDIARSRSTLASLTVPPLQALSQALLLQTLSTNVLASALSTLLYVSISTTSIYESGAIAATGLVYSLRRLQKRWEIARHKWETGIREEGRRALRTTEDIAREAVEQYKPEVDEIGLKERAIATDAVANVEKALENLKA